MCIAEVIERFLCDRHAKGRTVGTIKTYRDQLRLFQQWCDEQKIFEMNSLRERHIEMYLGEMRTRPNRKWKGDVSPVTVRKRAIGLRTLFYFAKERRLLKQNLAKRVLIPRGGRRRPKALTPEQVIQFLNTRRWKKDADLLRDYTLVILALDSGLRLAEVANLKIADVDFARGLIRVRSGKWDNDRGTVMLNETAQLVRAYVGARALCDEPLEMPVFAHANGKAYSKREIYLLVKRRAKQTRLEREVSPHRLRHTWLTEYLNNGGKIHTASDLAGHTDINTTRVYARTVSLVPVQQDHHKFSAVRGLVVLPLPDEKLGIMQTALVSGAIKSAG